MTTGQNEHYFIQEKNYKIDISQRKVYHILSIYYFMLFYSSISRQLSIKTVITMLILKIFINKNMFSRNSFYLKKLMYPYFFPKRKKK
ncbi:hypothetical protein NQ314_018932 [Rhamnusium bicolor]|uniref:Transmembrane protein n=1 Tax=Rhamnusium bicolor TaxID=1586634 RepID=A0AAV8WPZ8_9CUCU|nr:hypothetical protein NQ314_018932 [Rhamnusium bicolor]